MELKICLYPTVSGSPDDKCVAWFTTGSGIAQNFVDRHGYLGASSHTIVLDSPFGQDYQSATSDSKSTTTSTSWQEKLSMTTPALTGTYLISYQMELSSKNGVEHTQARVNGDSVMAETATISQEKTLFSGFKEVVFTGSAKTFTIDYKKDPPGSDTAEIEAARLTIWRVG